MDFDDTLVKYDRLFTVKTVPVVSVVRSDYIQDTSKEDIIFSLRTVPYGTRLTDSRYGTVPVCSIARSVGWSVSGETSLVWENLQLSWSC